MEIATTLPGQGIRRHPENPIREVTMAGSYWVIPEEGGIRVGRFSTNWLLETATQAWANYYMTHTCYQTSLKHDEIIQTTATEQSVEGQRKKTRSARDQLRDMIEEDFAIPEMENRLDQFSLKHDK